MDPVGHGVGLEEMLFGGRGEVARATLLQERKRGFEETVKPIEPFVLVVLLFTIPLVVASTSGCKEQTKRAWTPATEPELPCELVCHSVLALRAAALSAVFFANRRNRAEIWSFRELCRKVGARLSGGVARLGYGIGSQTHRVRFGTNPYRADDDARSAGGSRSFGRADVDVQRMGPMAQERLFELDDSAEAARQSVENEARAGGVDAGGSASAQPYERFED